MSGAPRRNSTLALAAACLSSLMFGQEISSVPAILPTLESVLHADFQQLQWTMNAYTLAVATVLMGVGTLADRYGRKRLFIVSTAAFGITSLVCGIAPNMPVLITGRALQGAAGGAMLICQIAVLSQQFTDADERAKAFGWWGIVFGFGLGFGPVVGNGIASFIGWEWVFLVHGLVAILTVALAIGGVRETRDPNIQHLDIAGTVSLSAAVFCLVFYITQGSQLGFSSPVSLAVAATALGSFAVFVAIERSRPHPMFDFAVFKVRRFSGALLGSMGMNFSFWPFMIYIPIWFEAGLGLDGVTAGVALLAYTLPTLVVPPFAERLLLRRGPGTVIPAGLFTIGLGFMTMKLGSVAGDAILPVTLIGASIAGYTMAGGIASSISLDAALAATAHHGHGGAKPFTFLQISDTHIGFDKPANPDARGTAIEAVEKIRALPFKPDLIIHTGDITHLSTDAQFDDAAQILSGLASPIFYVPGEHDLLDEGQGQNFLARYGKGTLGTGWHSFDHNGVHFVALNNVANLKAGGMAHLGNDQLAWLQNDLAGQSTSTPIVVFAHIPLWTVYEQWGWGTDDSAQALALLQRFGSVTVLNGHIHQIIQKTEGNITFHSARSTAYPQPAPGAALSPGPLKVPREQLPSMLGIRTARFVRGSEPIALIDQSFA